MRVWVVIFCLHEREVFLENDPDSVAVLQLSADNQLHINHLPIFVPHALGQPGVLIVEVLVAVQGHVAQPADLLSAGAAEHLEVLVADVDRDAERLHLLDLTA